MITDGTEIVARRPVAPQPQPWRWGGYVARVKRRFYWTEGRIKALQRSYRKMHEAEKAARLKSRIDGSSYIEAMFQKLRRQTQLLRRRTKIENDRRMRSMFYLLTGKTLPRVF